MTEDVGTLDSGLNSMVLANNKESILLPVNEPTHGTPRKSQIQASSCTEQALYLTTSFLARSDFLTPDWFHLL